MTATLPVTGAELSEAVAPQEYARLLGWPRGRALQGDLAERANAARGWYARHGRPFVAWRRVALGAVDAPVVVLAGGDRLQSTALAERLRRAEAHALVALAASAGPEAGAEADRHWAEGRPDDGFFLDRFAAAVTERLVLRGAAMLCRAAEPEGETLLAHLSPGCSDWDLADQRRLWALIFDDGSSPSGPLRLLDSGGLFPRHSVLAGLGVTRRAVAAAPADACRSCDLSPCGFRRAPYGASSTVLELR